MGGSKPAPAPTTPKSDKTTGGPAPAPALSPPPPPTLSPPPAPASKNENAMHAKINAELRSMKYRDLQMRCKELGIKRANRKANELIADLLEVELALRMKMKKSQEGEIDPEDDADC
jgi:hypothetical protein